jgi:hypothetical protein
MGVKGERGLLHGAATENFNERTLLGTVSTAA